MNNLSSLWSDVCGLKSVVYLSLVTFDTATGMISLGILHLMDDHIYSGSSTLAALEPPETPHPVERNHKRTYKVWRWFSWRKAVLFALTLFLFILAIILMKEGAETLTPLIRNYFDVNNPVNSLGFGWLFAYVIMSGSPVAAAALTFLEAGALGRLSAFTMVIGSRLGASFIVLFIGFIYVLRGRNKATSLHMGLLSLTVTGSSFFMVLLVGLALLRSGSFDQIQLQPGQVFISLTDHIFDPLVALFLAVLPRWSLFAVGMVMIIISFNLFDRCLPQMALKESQVGQISRLIYQPWVMFLLGAAVTLISMSVSVSLSVLVPLSHRGFVRRENVIPYIMGANVTTFIDTLFAAVLINNPAAFTIVFVSMVSIALVSAIVLLLFYRHFQNGILQFVDWIMIDDRHLAFFMIIILILPLLLLLI